MNSITKLKESYEILNLEINKYNKKFKTEVVKIQSIVDNDFANLKEKFNTLSNNKKIEITTLKAEIKFIS